FLLRAALDQLARQNQHDDHADGVEVEVYVPAERLHRAVEIGRSDAQREQRLHADDAVEQSPPSEFKNWQPAVEDNRGRQGHQEEGQVMADTTCNGLEVSGVN